MRSAALAFAHALVLASASACTFEDGVRPDGGAGQIVDDTFEELSAGTSDGIDIDALGLLAPEAYIGGGLHARAYAGSFVTATMTWAQLQAVTLPPLLGEAYAQLPAADWPYGRPFGLGIFNTDAITIVYDGEIYLSAGTTHLQVYVDDRAFVEIDLGATRALVHAQVNDNPLIALSVDVPTTGWYPLHAAMSDDGGPARFRLSTIEPGGTFPITTDRLRARTTHAPGLLVSAISDRVPRAALLPTTSVEQDLALHDWSGYRYPSYDIDNLANDNYTVRYTGQLRVDKPESHVFTFDLGPPSTVYARLHVDGTVVASNWGGGAGKLQSDPVALSPGWHDILVDYAKIGGGGAWNLQTSIDGAPPTPIPASRLRPVATSGNLVAAGHADVTLADATDGVNPGITTAPVMFSAPAGATIDFIDVFFWLQNETHTDLTVAVDHAGVAEDVPLGTLLEGYYDYIGSLAGLAGLPVDGTWNVVFTDHVHSNSPGAATFIALTATYHGGPGGPFVTRGSYISAPHATPGATSIDAVTISADLGGGQVATSVRVAADETSLADAPWTDIVGGTPIPAGNVMQYRLTLISDGWEYPTVDRVEVDYR
jgi:hypothetical protein